MLDVYVVLDEIFVRMFVGVQGMVYLLWFFGECSLVDDVLFCVGIFNMSMEYNCEMFVRVVFEGVVLNICWMM